VVRDPQWAGDAADTRIAYRSGDDLRVIAGDGNPATDHLVSRDVSAFAWRPVGYAKIAPPQGNGFVLVYIDSAGARQAVNVDSGLSVPLTRADLRRLPKPGDGGVDPDRRALSPDGSRLAGLKHIGATDRLIVIERHGRGSVLFSARSRLTGPTWSPDGRWLLVGWPAADQWLFIDPDRPHRVKAFERISEQFDPGGEGPAPFPAVSGWILPER
jgi:hypothetical protein